MSRLKPGPPAHLPSLSGGSLREQQKQAKPLPPVCTRRTSARLLLSPDFICYRCSRTRGAPAPALSGEEDHRRDPRASLRPLHWSPHAGLYDLLP